MRRPDTMQIEGCVALVTGSNRGIGREFVRELLARGATKVYAAARRPDTVERWPGVEPLALDVTDHEQVAAVAAHCADVQLLVNNAGVNQVQGLIAATDLAAAELEIRTNYLGPLALCRAFAPVLKAGGGGAIVVMVSILARAAIPACGSASASKAAALSMTQCVRAELAAQGTQVVAVLPGVVDTDMMRAVPGPKMPPAEVVTAALDGLERGEGDVHPGEMAAGILRGLAADPQAVEREFARMLPW
jgi:NAD(P)-dependent dehydrogenase (short-subunit alcohol dehydrogenase family)